ncbi:MAG: hypothetical protein R3C11_19255 [Planctomycetaceae bacterium]
MQWINYRNGRNSREDLVDVAFELKELKVESLPVNFLIRSMVLLWKIVTILIPGTA